MVYDFNIPAGKVDCAPLTFFYGLRTVGRYTQCFWLISSSCFPLVIDSAFLHVVDPDSVKARMANRN